jgi:hypothetical protein
LRYSRGFRAPQFEIYTHGQFSSPFIVENQIDRVNTAPAFGVVRNSNGNKFWHFERAKNVSVELLKKTLNTNPYGLVLGVFRSIMAGSQDLAGRELASF